MHFYPGVAEYQEPGKDPYRVFLNEDTLRSMDPTFAGRPIFVEHVDEVEENIDQLRKEADGWVIESFYNAADGKHWVKFIVVSEHGEKAIARGMRLSNAYIPLGFTQGGLWNGVSYAKEVTGGEFEHLAIVRNPRYEESVIMTPEKFKLYNEEKLVELKRLSNSKDKKGDSEMGFKLFKKTKVENTIDLEGMCVVLPKSGKEVTITQLVNDMDEMEDAKEKNEVMADLSHKVKMHDGSMCNVGELLAKHKEMHDALEGMKKDSEESEEISEEMSELGDHGGDKSLDNDDEDKDAKKKALELAAHEDKEIDAAKKKNALAKAKALRNAGPRTENEQVAVVEFGATQVERGKTRYGSN